MTIKRSWRDSLHPDVRYMSVPQLVGKVLGRIIGGGTVLAGKVTVVVLTLRLLGVDV